MNTCIYTKGERRKLGKVGNSIFFIPIFSSSPTASFDIEPIKRITGKLFLPRITMLVGKTYRSKCRNAGRVRRALGDPLFFENARIERERERVSWERSRDVNVFREDVPWPRAAPNNKALKRLATTTPTRHIKFREKREIRPSMNPRSLVITSFFLRKRFSPTFNPEKFREIQANVRLHGNRMRVLLIEGDQGDFFTIFKSMQFLSGAVQH